jgi:hypothetical protein
MSIYLSIIMTSKFESGYTPTKNKINYKIQKKCINEMYAHLFRKFHQKWNIISRYYLETYINYF